MANPTDVMLSQLEAEIEERKHFQEALVAAAQEDKRDLRKEELELIEQASKRMTELELRCGPLRESVKIAHTSAKRTAELAEMFAVARDPRTATGVEYRSAGAYLADVYHAGMGDQEAAQRVDLFNRVAAHQTTTDNPGLLPERIVAPVVNFVNTARPLVNVIGPTDLGDGSWAYAKVTQHTQVGEQSAEKAELASRKMLVTKTAITAPTLGGYVNVSRQDIRRTSPGILDMVINDLAGQYAIETEEAMGAALVAAATAGPEIPASPTALEIATAIWGAAGTVVAGTNGQGSVVIAVAPDRLGVVGPLFPNIGAMNAFSAGLDPTTVAGPAGSIASLTTVVSPGLAAGTILVFSTAAAWAFEYIYGNMQIGEPSVWGVQVGYAGDFEAVVHTPAGVVAITEDTP